MNTNSKYDYTVIEDNGGGLHLFLFEPGAEEILEGYDGFEYTPGSLVTSLDDLDAGHTTRGWEGRKANPQEDWEYIQSHDTGYQVVCYGEHGERTLYPERMGAAAKLEFNVTE